MMGHLENKSSVMVIGSGIAGTQAALDLANRGIDVYLVERAPSIGGTVTQLNCSICALEIPVDCSICPFNHKMAECYDHPNIKLLTNSEVREVTGSVGNFKIKILKKPRFVDEDKCIGCGVCIDVCPVSVPENFGERKAIYMQPPQAIPQVPAIDEENCVYFPKKICRRCQRVCEFDAINFDQEAVEMELKADAIIVATGLRLFDPSAVREYGYKRYENILTTLELERLTSVYGPTKGKLLRPSDKTMPNTVVFIQCVGSRSRRMGNTFCSGICCMYTVKDTILVKLKEPKTDVYVFYMDLRVFGRGYQELITKAQRTGT